jgi:flagellar biosynthesis protein FlhA
MNQATGTQKSAFNSAFEQKGDILFALGIVAILSVLILPMPRWLLDLSLALSITFSVVILMTVLFIREPLEFNSFPSVLLIATMMRLALNIASTRLILRDGHGGTSAAGDVIETFGRTIMGDNFLIGLIVFGILIIINFIVITKGAGRIAEVSARFSLDAMPGKQMAVDADLSSGLISESEAKERRRKLEEESGFFGAMDGASKFVRGDAIAGILITFISVIGGIIIGSIQHDMTLSAASKTYTLLTIGDGLVSQVPALIVSTAAGLLVTKGGSTETTNKAFIRQLGRYPSALALSAFLMGVLALMPGLPLVPFALLSMVSGYGAWMTHKAGQEREAITQQQKAIAETKEKEGPEPINKALEIDAIKLELGYGVIALATDDKDGNSLTDQIKSLRHQIANEMGIIMPSTRLKDNIHLDASTYVIYIRNIEAGRGEVRTNMLLAMDPNGETITLPGEATREPTFGLPAMWIQSSLREEALFKGYTVVEPGAVITTHISEILKDNLHEILTYGETQKLLDRQGEDNQKLIEDIIPKDVSVGTLQRVLQGLLKERVSVRDLPTILEAIAEVKGQELTMADTIEHVRFRLARQISFDNVNEEGYIPMVTLSIELEQAFQASLSHQGNEVVFAMAPDQIQEFIQRIQTTYDEYLEKGIIPILLTGPATRPHARTIIERFRPNIILMSQREVHPKVRIKTFGQI